MTEDAARALLEDERSEYLDREAAQRCVREMVFTEVAAGVWKAVPPRAREIFLVSELGVRFVAPYRDLLSEVVEEVRTGLSGR